jgi:hypothetical protein
MDNFDSKMTEYLNEQLAMENAVADRLVTRIQETPLRFEAAPGRQSRRDYEMSGKSVSTN